MKLSIDPSPGSELMVRRPWLKAVGSIVLVTTLALIAFDDYWPPYLQSLLVGFGVEQSKAEYLVYLAGYLFYLGLAVGGFLMFKAREKPLCPTKDEVRDGKF